MKGKFARLAGSLLPVLGLMLLTLSGSAVSQAAPLRASDLPDGMVGVTWQLESMQTAPPAVVRPMEQGIIVTLEFDGQGGLTGHGACNDYFATYKVGANNAITIGPIGSTRKACAQNLMDLDQHYFAVLQSVDTYSTTQGHLGLWNKSTGAIVNYISSAPPTSPGTTPGIPTSRTFPETGKTVQGQFLDYWNNNGGLQQQGYPISEEMQEVSDTDGKTYTVQYFERAEFEYHPELATANKVLLSLLGTFLYNQKYPNGAPNQQVNRSPGTIQFPQTGHSLGGKFKTYWETHGGLAQQGYPISDEFTEVSPLDGRTYTVQYFQRAVFELHPELAGTPYEVLLSQLGHFRYDQKYGAAATPAPAPTPTPGGARTITITSPPPGYVVRSSPVTVSGTTNYYPFEGNLSYQVLNTSGQQIGTGSIQVQGNIGEPGSFSAPVAFTMPATASLITIQIYERDQSSGQIIASASLSLQAAP
jgi:heat shock protein HslJ